jgi:hypothetical protein
VNSSCALSIGYSHRRKSTAYRTPPAEAACAWNAECGSVNAGTGPAGKGPPGPLATGIQNPETMRVTRYLRGIDGLKSSTLE